MGFFYPDPDHDPSALSLPILLTVESSDEADETVKKLLRGYLPHKSIFVRGTNVAEVKNLRTGNLHAYNARNAAIGSVVLLPLAFLFFTWLGIPEIGARIAFSIECAGVGFIFGVMGGVFDKSEQTPYYYINYEPSVFEIRVKAAHFAEAQKILGIDE